MRRALLVTLLVAIAASCGDRSATVNSPIPASTTVPTSPASPASETTTAIVATATTIPTTTTTAPPALALGATGSVYGLERGGDLIEYVLATGIVRRWKVPEEVRNEAAKNIVVLADGLALYNRVGVQAAVFPVTSPDQPLVVPDAMFPGASVDVWAANQNGAVDLIIYDGTGAAVGGLRGPRPTGDNGSMVLVDADRLLFNDLKVLHLSSRQVDRIGEGSLVGRNANGVAGQVCDSTGCTVSVYNWAGDTLASARLATSALSNEKQSADSTTGRVGNLRAGLLNPDGRFLVFGWLGKVTEPGEVRRLDFTTGQTATLFRQDGFPQAAALTNDGGSALVSVDSRTGSFRLISLADPTRTATAELGANVLTITAGPSMQPR